MEMAVDASDPDLVRSGNTAALVQRHYGPVYGLVHRFLRNDADARDAAQETFARAIRHLPEFDPRKSFRAWLFAIAANHVRDLMRRRRQLPLDSKTQEQVPDLTLPEEPLLHQEDRDRILAAVDRLPFDLKLVVTLHYQKDFSSSEIAESLGLSVNAVRLRLYRALAALRKELS
ncbi:MAG TPA: sigma-70 family RNA polymerase sigma factor [Planctomycetota bacterium]|jgi:RNA polymerase sigma-70 factor (ECF subfamily)|nr:sigma-70 family RNA polymerase sigma factor [Planctomycetota bacterium]